MKYMYVNYKSHLRESFIVDDHEIKHDYTAITQENIPESSLTITDTLTNKFNNTDINLQNFSSSSCYGSIINIEPYIEAKEKTINEEITQFFFDSIHKNYLKSRS